MFALFGYGDQADGVGGSARFCAMRCGGTVLEVSCEGTAMA